MNWSVFDIFVISVFITITIGITIWEYSSSRLAVMALAEIITKSSIMMGLFVSEVDLLVLLVISVTPLRRIILYIRRYVDGKNNNDNNAKSL